MARIRKLQELGDLTLSQMRSYGTPAKVSPNQIKIGGVKSGLYYDKDLPFLKTRLKKKHSGEKTYTHYYLRGQEKEPSDMLDVARWDPVKKKKVMERVRRDDPRLSWYTTKAGNEVPTLLEFGRMTKGEKIAKPLVKKILDNPKKYGALDDKGNLSTHKVRELVNAKFADAGLKPYAGTVPVNRILQGLRGQIKFPIIGTPKETEIVNFLKKDDLYKTITSKDEVIAKKFPDVPSYIIDRIRQVKRPGFLKGLVRTNIGDIGSTSKVSLARRKLERMIKKKYGNLTDQQVEAVAEHGRTMLQSKRHTPIQPRYGSRYADEDIQVAFNFLDDTFLKHMPREINEYAFERSLNELRRLVTGKKWTAGHSRRSPEDWWWFGGDEVAAISPQLSGRNLEQLKLDSAFQAAIRSGDIATAEKKMIEMMQKGMRSSMAEGRMVRNPKTGKDEWDDEFGELIFYGAPPKKGKMAEGGIVNGYSKGGKVKKLLDDAIGMMSRRKFLKGTGATALSAAIPKSALKLAAPVVQKGALNFAPPWVNGMLSSLKNVKDLGALGQRRSVMGGGMSTGNDAKIINLGTKNIKVYKDQDAKITYFKIKTRDEKVADDIAKSKGEKTEDYWDDVELREEPGQKTITFKNKEYDGNDQHIVIDKINKETRFVDDNWHMEAGGEDIAKDDWIEWAITPNKNEIKVALKKPLSEIDDAIVDGYSVNDMENYGMHSYVDSFSPSGNIFGTVERMVKKIKKKDMLRREKKWNDEHVRNLKEKEMMDWEGQFRGGKGIHGYYRGGMSMQDYPPSMDMDRIINAIGMQESSGGQYLFGDPIRFDVKTAPHQRTERGQGLLHIRPSTALDPGHDIPAWKNFHTEWRDKDKQKQFARNYLNKAHRKFGTWEDAISSWLWGFGNVEKKEHNLDYYNKIMGHYNKGGIARRPNAVPPLSGPDPYATFIEDSIGQMKANPSEFMGSQFIQKFNKGGFVKKYAPAVIGKLTNYKPKLTMSDVLKNVQKAKKAKPPTNPYIIYGKDLTPLKKFKTRDEAQTWLDRNYGDNSNIHPEVVHYEKAKTTLKSMEPKAEKPGAMFWGSREKIIGAPSEAMTGTQWLQYMKIGKHGILNPKGYPRIKDMELNDTSLAPWLSRQGTNTVSKDALVKQFDAMAPQMEVTVLGESTGGRIFDDMSRKLKEVDTQAIRDPAIKGFFDYIKSVLPTLKSSRTGKEADEIAKHIDDMVYRNFGVENALEAGVPQRFPFEIKEILQQISTGLGKRTAGFKSYTRSPQHRGTQTMAGGDNYREFLFRYKPGSLRQTEPQYKYAHDFNLSDADRAGGVVHARTSDRADQFGRRILHIEEIQSDMHQKVNMAQRQLKKMHADWAKAGKTPEGEYKKMNTLGKKDYNKLVASGKYAPRGDLKEEIATANEQHLLLVKAKIEDLLTQKQTPAIRTRINRLNTERKKVRKMIEEEKAKMAEGSHSGVPQGPLSKTEDYNEFIMKYMLRVAREGGYDGITINTPAIKNLNMSSTGRDFKGNLIAYGPMAQGAMKKAANKSGAKFMKTVIVDEDKRVWEVPMILIKENKAAQSLIDKGLPIYKKGGTVKK
jgi:hypothetical protein